MVQEGGRQITGVVLARYANLEQARDAMTTLERGGLEAGQISLLGRQVEESLEEEAHDTKQTDAGVTKDVTKRVAAGATGGGVAGGLAGFLAGAAAFAIPGVGPVLGTGVWLATAGGATVGGVLGGFFSGFTVLPQSEEWETTYQNALREGEVILGAELTSDDEMRKVVDRLQGTNALAIDRYDDQGNRL